jgi:hypothetical protein
MSFFEKMSKEDKLSKAKELFQDSVTADGKWQREAREDFAFRDGQQWTSDEKRILAEERRPCLTFNLTKSSIDLIMGLNEDNRITHRCSPVENSDGFLAEVLNDISEWVQETHSFVDEEDAALESAACSGRGYVAIDFTPDPKRFGEIIMSEISVPVHEIHFDPAARRRDLGDASYIFWDRWLTGSDFRIRYPKVSEKKVSDILENSKRSGPESVQKIFEDNSSFPADRQVSGSDESSDYTKPMDLDYYDKNRNMIRVIHCEYWTPYKRGFAFNPKSGEWIEFDFKMLKDIKKEYETEFGQAFVYETLMDKKVYWLQFTGADILFDDISPLPYDGFSIVPLFVFMDASRRTANHYGIVRLLKDPQKEVNKRWSQTLNMLNQQVQTGVFAETDAFVNQQQAEQSMKEPGTITWLNSGALNSGKVKTREVPKFPDAPMQLEQYSQDIMKKISGINPDLLGQDRGRQEPGVVIRLRQQQGITLLKPLFRSVNNMKKELFKRQLSIIMAYMPDQQILRILGGNERYKIDAQTGTIIDQMTQSQTPLRDVRNLEYNIIGEEAPGNMSKRMLELSALMEMQTGGFPVPPEQIIEKMSISESEKTRWLQYLEQQQKAQSEQQQQMMQIEMQLKDRELAIQEQKNQIDFLLGNAKLKLAAQKDEIKAASTEREGERTLMIAAQANESKVIEAQQGMQLKAIEARQKLEADRAMNDERLLTAKESGNVQIGVQKETAELQVESVKNMTQAQLRSAAAKLDAEMKANEEKLKQLKAAHEVKLEAMKRESVVKETLMKKQAAMKPKKPQGDSKK